MISAYKLSRQLVIFDSISMVSIATPEAVLESISIVGISTWDSRGHDLRGKHSRKASGTSIPILTTSFRLRSISMAGIAVPIAACDDIHSQAIQASS